MIEEAIDELTPVVGVKQRAALGEPWGQTGPPGTATTGTKSPAPPKPDRVATPQPRALSEVERKEIQGVLSDRARR